MRRLFRSVVNGQLGELVLEGGRKLIKPDRPGEPDLRLPYNEKDWEPAEEQRPLTRMQIAKVCFEADRAMASAVGPFSDTLKDWRGLSDKQRLTFASEGPDEKTHPYRKQLWDSLQDFFAEHLK